MSGQSALVHLMVVAFAVSPVMAQPQQADAERWRSFAEQLPPNALVTVHLRTGERVEGHIVQVTTDSLQVNTKTRTAAPVRDLPFDTIQSIAREKEMSHGAKRGIWAAVITAAAFIIITILAEATRG